MQAVFSRKPFEEVEVKGTAAEWRAFASAMEHDGAEITCERAAVPWPYQESASVIRVVHRKDRKILVSTLSGNEVAIAGDSAYFQCLAATAVAVADSVPGTHVHVDYLDEASFIARDSASTVFVRA